MIKVLAFLPLNFFPICSACLKSSNLLFRIFLGRKCIFRSSMRSVMGNLSRSWTFPKLNFQLWILMRFIRNSKKLKLYRSLASSGISESSNLKSTNCLGQRPSRGAFLNKNSRCLKRN